MRKIASLLATVAMAAGLTVATATPALAEQYCFGTPSEPLAFVCVEVTGGVSPDPQITWTERPVTVTSVCYGVGCTQETTVNVLVPSVGGGNPTVPSVTVYWGGSEDFSEILQRVVEEAMERLGGFLELNDPICFTKPAICLT